MKDLIPVGTPVTVPAERDNYLHNYGMSRDDLVVLHYTAHGYGLGPAKNDPAKAHHRDGWIFFTHEQVTPKPQESKVTRFKKGDKVEFIEDYADFAKTGDRATVQEVVCPEDGPEALIRFVEDVEAAYASRLKLVEAPKAETLKVGDKVAVDMDQPTYGWHATEGVVIGERSFGHRVRITKVGANNPPFVKVGDEYTLTNLTILPPFTFNDIQVGDTIRRTLIREGGTKEVREGTVSKLGWFAEANGYILAYDGDTAGAKDVTLELVNRPEPEPVKEAWETAKTGDRLVVKNEEGCIRVLTKREDGQWGTLLIRPSGSSSNGFNRSDQTLKQQLTQKPFSVGKPQFIPAFH